MDRTYFSNLASAVDQEGKISEHDARRLVAVAQGRDPGEVRADEALDFVVHAFTGRAIEILDEATGRLPHGVGLDETRLLDEALAAVREAATDYDPARGDFGARVTHRVWRVAAKRTKAVLAAAPPFVPLGSGCATSEGERAVEPPDPGSGRPEDRAAIGAWANGRDLSLERPIRARRRPSRG